MSFLNFDIDQRSKQLKKSKPTVGRYMGSVAKKKEAQDDAQKLLELAKRRKEEEEEKSKIRIREEKRNVALEDLKTGGFKMSELLTPFAISNENSNKVILPPSILERLVSQGIMENRNQVTQPLTFELTVESGFRKGNKTRCGVEEFSAVEGQIGLPLKTALSLASGAAVDDILKHDLRIKFVETPRYESYFLKLRPLEDGFHQKNEEVVNIDIADVLERSLSQHLVISKNDLIPLLDLSGKFILRVEDIYPTSVDDFMETVEVEDEELVHIPTSFVVLNAEVKIDLLPSENAQKDLDRISERTGNLERTRQKLHQLAKSWEEIKTSETEQSTTIRARLPNGQAVTKKFGYQEKLRNLFLWISFQVKDAELGDDYDFEHSAQNEFPFILSQPFSKTRNKFINENLDKSFLELALSERGYAISIVFPKVKATGVPEETEPKASNVQSVLQENEWMKLYKENQTKTAKDNVYKEIIQEPALEMNEFMEVTEESNKESEALYAELVEIFQVDPATATTISRNYLQSIVQLKEMGFGDRLLEASHLLLKYNGRVLRVANALVGNT